MSATPETESPSVLAGPKIMLEGPSGSGKTRALGTMVDWAARQNPPREVDVLFTENGLETLLGYWRDRKLPVPTNLHWHVSRISGMGLEELIKAANSAGAMTYEGLTKQVDPNRAKNNPWEKILRLLVDFPDDRTGTKRGNIGTWGADRIFINDSLSETASACFRMQTGIKPVASQPDYMVAQQNLINWLRWMTQQLQCTFVITAHVGRQVKEITGATQLMTKAIGRALADDIPQLFSETIYTYREGTNWYWDTAASNVDTKTRYLPIASKIPPDFAQIMDKWLERSKV
ncbi:MAG: hypothetical protein LLG08_07135 [Actinomycetia bacterium]|nr:hypothetical protein [Actinomycetes bacterium]